MSALNEEIIVVSGLPRSGTSLMMQMLAAGGIEPLTDQVRGADSDNPRGYFEFERVKKIKQDRAWLPEARGKAVKMISQLLYELPDTETYRVIFMRRDLDEIIRSQETMLTNRGVALPNPSAIKEAFETHLRRLFDWLPNRPCMEFVEVHYSELVTEPNRCTAQIAQLLSKPVDIERMCGAVDPTLYRNREDRVAK